MSAHLDAPARERVIAAGAKPLPAILKPLSLAAALVGFAIFGYGVAIGNNRVWHAFQLNWLFFTTISSAGVMFVAVQRITTARWSRGIIRFLEGYVAFLPVAFVGLLVLLAFGKGHAYPWWTDLGELKPEKQLWLGHRFFAVRDAVVFGALAFLQLWYVWTSVRLDVGVSPEGGAPWAAGLRARMRVTFGDERRELHSTHSLQGKLAVFMALLFGFGWCVLAWDQSMSLDPYFFSTMYGWLEFMGGWLVALMTLAALVRFYRKHLEAEDLITEAHYHDLGKLGFAFTAFWGYLAFSQFLVIWYGNMVEETHFFTLRLTNAWTNWTMAAALLTFVLPFFGLLSVKAKTYSPVMLFFALSSFVGLWLVRYVEVYPSVYGVSFNAPFHIWEAGIFLGFLGAWGFCYTSFMDAFPKFRVLLLTSQYRDEVQVPVDPRTMEPLPAHE
ncbi:MAG: hypothetical protein HY084_00140 [Gemmatimonadetes bacterium]|nr:hypothetical protein [Gemmatimonadota bacterium]